MCTVNVFERMSQSCKYYEPGMPVYDEPDGVCLYRGRTGESSCFEKRCPLLAESEKGGRP